MAHGLRHDEDQGGGHHAANKDKLRTRQSGADLLDQCIVGNEQSHGQTHGQNSAAILCAQTGHAVEHSISQCRGLTLPECSSE